MDNAGGRGGKAGGGRGKTGGHLQPMFGRGLAHILEVVGFTQSNLTAWLNSAYPPQPGWGEEGHMASFVGTTRAGKVSVNGKNSVDTVRHHWDIMNGKGRGGKKAAKAGRSVAGGSAIPTISRGAPGGILLSSLSSVR